MTQNEDGQELCPKCGEVMRVIYDNAGSEENPTNDIVGYECLECGYKDD